MKKVHFIFLSMFLMTPLMSMEAPPLPPEDLALLDLLTLHNETVASVQPFSSLDKTIRLIREGMRDETLTDIPLDPADAIIYIGANVKKNGTEDFAIPNEIKRHAQARKYNIGTIIPEVVLAEKGFFLLYDYVFNSLKTRPAVALTTGAIPKDLMSVPLQYHHRIIQELHKMGLHEVNNPRRLLMIQRLQAKFAEEGAEDVQRSLLGDIGQVGMGTGKKLKKTAYSEETKRRDEERMKTQSPGEQHPLASLLGATGAVPKPKPKFSPPQAVAAPPVDEFAGLSETHMIELQALLKAKNYDAMPAVHPLRKKAIAEFKAEKGITAPTVSAGPMGGGLFAGLADAAKKDRKAALDALDKPKTPSKSEGGDSGKGTGAPGGSTPVAPQFGVSQKALEQAKRGGGGTGFDAAAIAEHKQKAKEAREKREAEEAAKEAAKTPTRPNFVIQKKTKPDAESVVPHTPESKPPTTGWMAKKPSSGVTLGGGFKSPVAATMAVPERAAIDEEKLNAIVESLRTSFQTDEGKELTIKQGYLSSLSTKGPDASKDYLTQQIWENLAKFNTATNAIFKTQAMRAIKVAMDTLAERGDTRTLREIAGFDTDPGVVVEGE